jgi:hypothetical protein
VFPFERPPQPNRPLAAGEQAAREMLGEQIASRIRAGLDASTGGYTSVLYYPASPLVRRALGQGITPEDVERVVDPQRGVIDPDRALRIAAAMGTASAVIGSVEQYEYNPQMSRADVTVTVQWLQVPGGTPIKTVGVTATATAPPGASAQAVAQMAATEVATRALTEMAVPPPPPPVVTTTNGKAKARQQSETRPTGRNRAWLALAALLGVLATSVD